MIRTYSRDRLATVRRTSFPIHLPRRSISRIRYLLKTHFVPDVPQSLKVADVKMKLSRETSLKIRQWHMWKWSFRARRPSKSESGKCENEAYSARRPSRSENGTCENEAFVRDVPQNQKMAHVKMKLSCETSLKIWKWQMWKRSL